MKARLFVLLFLAVLGGAAETEPRQRPRLAPQGAGEEKPESAGEPRLEHEPTFAPRFRSFDSFLQAEARRPVGLGPVRETSENGTSTPRDARPAPSRRDAADAAGADLLILPTVEVTAKKVPAGAVRLLDIDSQLRSGEKASEETWLDSFLNPVFLFGETAKVRAARAKRRGEVLGWQKIMLLSLEVENSPAEKARIEADIEMLNTILRSWK